MRASGFYLLFAALAVILPSHWCSAQTADSVMVYQSDSGNIYYDSTDNDFDYTDPYTSYSFYDSSSTAQKSYESEAIQPRAFDKEKYREATEGKSYVEGAEEIKQKKKKEPSLDLSWLGPFTNVFLYGFLIVIIAFLVFILYRFFAAQARARNPDIPEQEALEFEWKELEERILETELDKYLREALERKDYRMAVRVYFLMAIKTMSEQGFIHWSKNKTNLDYLYETTTLFFHRDFKQATAVYESIWYGKQTIGEAQFQMLSQSFIRFLQNIRRK